MVAIVQLVRISVCGTEGRGFEPHWPPKNQSGCESESDHTRSDFFLNTRSHTHSIIKNPDSCESGFFLLTFLILVIHHSSHFSNVLREADHLAGISIFVIIPYIQYNVLFIRPHNGCLAVKY
jgi:hypothetical protein